MDDPTRVDVGTAKSDLRREMRALRHGVARDPELASRSARVCESLTDLLADLMMASDVQLVMVFEAVPGEPDLAAVVAWCRRHGVATVAPDPHPTARPPVDPTSVDVVVVPGLAFTADGSRLGQGGGWYDRFLAACRSDCLVVGVAFDEQVLDRLPTEPHDERVDVIVTDQRTLHR